ncbi:hypothetical protein E4U53_004362, partial [Claviceps sorghi]
MSGRGGPVAGRQGSAAGSAQKAAQPGNVVGVGPAAAADDNLAPAAAGLGGAHG